MNNPESSTGIPVSTVHFARTSNIVLEGDVVYVGAGWAVCALNASDGSLMARTSDGDAFSAQVHSLALASDGGAVLVLAARSNGTLAAYDPDDLTPRWSVVGASGTHVVGWEQSRQEDGSMDTTYTYDDASWQATDIVTHDGLAYVGFSSYSMDVPRSRLVAVDLATGELAWTTSFTGCFSFTGGACHPYAATAGLVVPIPEEATVALLDFATGDELARCAIDEPLHTGFTCIPKDAPGEGDLMAQTRTGIVYRFAVGERDLAVAASAAVSSGNAGATLPSCARPVVADDVAYVNQAVAEGDDWRVFAIDLETFEATDTGAEFAFASTPLVLQDGDEDADTVLVSLGTNGLWQLGISADFRTLGPISLLTDEVQLTDVAVDMSPVVDAESALYIASGTTERQTLYAIG